MVQHVKNLPPWWCRSKPQFTTSRGPLRLALPTRGARGCATHSARAAQRGQRRRFYILPDAPRWRNHFLMLPCNALRLHTVHLPSLCIVGQPRLVTGHTGYTVGLGHTLLCPADSATRDWRARMTTLRAVRTVLHCVNCRRSRPRRLYVLNEQGDGRDPRSAPKFRTRPPAALHDGFRPCRKRGLWPARANQVD